MKIGGYFIAALCLLAIVYGGWKVERWINWKFDYGNRVNQRIELLEDRVQELENRGRL